MTVARHRTLIFRSRPTISYSYWRSHQSDDQTNWPAGRTVENRRPTETTARHRRLLMKILPLNRRRSATARWILTGRSLRMQDKALADETIWRKGKYLICNRSFPTRECHRPLKLVDSSHSSFDLPDTRPTTSISGNWKIRNCNNWLTWLLIKSTTRCWIFYSLFLVAQLRAFHFLFLL